MNEFDKHLHELAATIAAGMLASNKGWDTDSAVLLACNSARIALEIIRRCDESPARHNEAFRRYTNT